MLSERAEVQPGACLCLHVVVLLPHLRWVCHTMGI